MNKIRWMFRKTQSEQGQESSAWRNKHINIKLVNGSKLKYRVWFCPVYRGALTATYSQR